MASLSHRTIAEVLGILNEVQALLATERLYSTEKVTWDPRQTGRLKAQMTLAESALSRALSDSFVTVTPEQAQ